MRLAAYARVSTVEQVDHGQGLDIQAFAIKKWAKSSGHRIDHFFQDEGVSGAIEDREGLESALACIGYNGVEGLVVTSLDRLARSLTVQEAALQQAWSAGGRVFAVDSGEVLADDPDDPMRTFVRQVLGAVSQLEAGMIRRRLKRGREHKAARGGYAHGAPPYGYAASGGELVPDEAEQEITTAILVMRESGASLREIARHLNDQGIPSKHGGRWHPTTVARVLNQD